MQLKDVVSVAGTAITALVVITGWFISKSLDRKHEIFKIGLQKRDEITQSLLEFTHKRFLNQNTEVEWHKLAILIQLYGDAQEIDAVRGIDGADAAQKIIRDKQLQNLLVRKVRTKYKLD